LKIVNIRECLRFLRQMRLLELWFPVNPVYRQSAVKTADLGRDKLSRPGRLADNVLTDAATATNSAASKTSITARRRRDDRVARGGPRGRSASSSQAGSRQLLQLWREA